MKVMAVALFIVLSAVALPQASGSSGPSPIEKVLAMVGSLEAKIIAEGEDAQKVYNELAEFCEDRSGELEREIKTGKPEVKELEAEIGKEVAKSESLNTKIEEFAADISTDEADLKAATEIRAKEKAAFEAEEAELIKVIGTLERAIGVLEKEMSKSGGAAMVQLKSVKDVAQALAVMVEATAMSTADATKLTEFLQSQSDEESDEFGAPAAANYKGKSGGIIESLQDLYEKAESQLEKARTTEHSNVQAYQMLVQSLKDSVKYAKKDMEKAKKQLAESAEAKAAAEGDLAVTSKDLAEDVKELSKLHQDCMKKAEDFEMETKSRGEELKALATAKKILQDTTGGAAAQTYNFLQMSSSTNQAHQHKAAAKSVNYAAVKFVRNLAHKQKSALLAQLATRMGVVMRAGLRTGADPFGKVKGMIKDMISKLEKEAEAEAKEKEWCDKALKDTKAKKAELEAVIEKISTRIDAMTAKSAKFKQEISTLQKELAALAKSQAEMDKLRAEEKAAFTTNSAEMKKGVEGIKSALKVLSEYYAKDDKAHTTDDSVEDEFGNKVSGSKVILGLLEAAESDFSKGLAEMVAVEEKAAAEYKSASQENEITKDVKTQDVKYKVKESKALDKQMAETASDRSTEQDELDSVLEYLKGVEERCIAKPESYEDKVKRREAEIAGLKEAASILEGEAVLLQRGTKHTLRGARIQSHA